MRKITCLLLALASLAWARQQTVHSVWNQRQKLQDGTAAPALDASMPATSTADGTTDGVSTACQATMVDLSGSTDATADLTCLTTGEIMTTMWGHITVTVHYTYSAGTAGVMQCDYSQDDGDSWAPVTYEDAAGALTVREWTVASPGSGPVVTANFPIDYRMMRCRVWFTGADSDDAARWVVVLGR